jgi:hypothetical protein
MEPADWGVAVEKGNAVYLHITRPEKATSQLTLNNFNYRLNKAVIFSTGKPVQYKTANVAASVTLLIPELDLEAIDNVIVLHVTR